ncbi:hypothetical protein PVAP13_7KG089000 [Panicum virgatum]|uniref:Uncharacterized protein n=1 Tax=Panicum virgatum TaxID=38727 RepID=A0A8T0QK42_PANVG|nr:hypothetical protein PVAP13_7KG089000 [Panicum virgatum]
MRAQAVATGQVPLPSAQVVSKVLPQNSSNNTFLKNAGLSTPSSKSSLAREAVQHRELNAQKQSSAVLHDHLEELKKKTVVAEEVLERTASLFDELKKQEQDSHLMLQKFRHVITSGISCQS